MQLSRTVRTSLLLALCTAACASVSQANTSLPTVDQHQTGTQYSPLSQINAGNVAQLEKVWEYRAGDLPAEVNMQELISLQDQPTLIGDNLIVCSATRQLTALNPATGDVRWTFNPEISDAIATKKCRGIGNWTDIQAETGSECKTRLFLGTTDYRLIAIDANTGKRCSGFGDNGEVQMPPSKEELWPGEVAAGSNPTVINDVVVVGSSVADMQRADPPSGRVMAYDARSGEFRWSFDPVPRDASDPAMATWGKGTDSFGQGNVWSSMATDQALDLIYLPTTSASDDYYGGNRPGDNLYSTSVVALRGSTGEVVWHQQLVHHNVWDYDIPARPMLIDYPHNGEMVPALVQNTKMGMIFVFDRATGEPLVPIEERPVPQEGIVPGEVLSPTQPFPVGMPNVMPHSFSPEDTWGFTPIDAYLCKSAAEEYDYGPIYTPISEKGTIMMPAAGGGPNWGSGGYDPDSNIMVIPSNRVPMVAKLVPRAKAKETYEMNVEGLSMGFSNPGSDYALEMKPLMSPLGAPCSAPPWAALTAVDIVKKEIVWEVPLGSLKKMMPFGLDLLYGTPGAGGPLVTAGGLVFIGYTLDNSLRAFDIKTGEVLWEDELPFAGNSVPVTYEVNGEQYIVMPAGGHSMYTAKPGDAFVAYKLKK
ncbi:pyrroloquinoline quinone-dependent dehydrogenase [Pseudomaricurvus sp. HS19]|uniref:pyrroloquinoline quinone-dependent dehydrogenase n=1 Tax=Pseudomaricurvus sp. HS19 TaxID=2692626 RepID=UPI00137119DD|nr:pyrroloquinoline quinone-dependent dehydrogenase [Pseudomaricurvus sp. HS19]MYM64058.1 PQQ-binding-like beta-propeller repeat protein [Pseudomaricurvus sp. HS19]